MIKAESSKGHTKMEMEGTTVREATHNWNEMVRGEQDDR